MSSGLRNIQRAQKRGINFMGRGSKLGVTNPGAKDLLARQKRDKKWGRKDVSAVAPKKSATGEKPAGKFLKSLAD